MRERRWYPIPGRDSCAPRSKRASPSCRCRERPLCWPRSSRPVSTLAELADAGADRRQAVVAREMTKHFEEVRRGTVGELAAYYREAPARGEVVIVVAGGERVKATGEQ